MAAAWERLEGDGARDGQDPDSTTVDGNDFFIRMRAGWRAGEGYDMITTEASKGLPRTFLKLYGYKLEL